MFTGRAAADQLSRWSGMKRASFSVVAVTFLLLLVGYSRAFAQQPVYEAFEVDTVARVQGGAVPLDDFVEATYGYSLPRLPRARPGGSS